eukprot:14978675-Ditylum_brightwellii.AAC.3
MVTNKVWCPIKLSELPKGTKILTTTWACKLKSNGWSGLIHDVQGVFLKGELDQEKEQMAMKEPQGFEKHYPDNVMLWLLMAISGTKQAAIAFWQELFKCMHHMGYKCSGIDPCLYFKWTNFESNEFTSQFDNDKVGKVKEYVGCKIDHNKEERSIKFTQSVLLQSYNDKYETTECQPVMPAEVGMLLVKAEKKEMVGSKRHTCFRSGVGKLLHMTGWLRPEVQNSIRELARQGNTPASAHINAMHCAMEYCAATTKCGWSLKPTRVWDGKDKTF